MPDEPKFYSRNYIGPENTNTASTGQATMPRIFDRDSELKWQSIGSSDVTAETLRSIFLVGGLAIQRTVDTVIVLGHNIKQFKVQFWDGVIWADVPGAAVAAETNDYTVFTFTPLACFGIGLHMTTTQVVDAQKRVGEFLALATILAFPTDDGIGGLSISAIPTAVNAGMFDLGVSVNQLRWAGNRVDRYAARLDFNLIAKSLYKSVRSLLRNPAFTIYPEPAQNPDELFLVTATQTPVSAGYASPFKGSGYNFTVEVREV